MKRFSSILLAAVILGVPAHVLAQNELSEADRAQLFHQGIVTGCIYQFKTDPKAASLPQELRDSICTCMDNWFRTNNINDAAAAEANKPVMPKVAMYCMQAAVGQ